MPKFEKKNKSCLLNSPVVSKNVYLWGERRGSKWKTAPRLCDYTHSIGPLTISCWRRVRAGDSRLSWEPELVSPGFTFTRLVRDVSVAWCCVCFGVLFLVCFVFSVPDLSFWPRCPTMTILAQLNVCHSCNDARSTVQKKNVTIFMVHSPYHPFLFASISYHYENL